MLAIDTPTIRFERERETKNMVRFAEVVEDESEPVIGTLYVRKSCLATLGDPGALVIDVRPEPA